MNKSDYTTGGETPANQKRRKSKRDNQILNSIEWLIIILLTLLVLLLSLSSDSSSSGASSAQFGKSLYCDNGKNFFVPLNKVDCQKDPNAPGCRRTDCKPCPQLGSCTHGNLSVSAQFLTLEMQRLRLGYQQSYQGWRQLRRLQVSL